MVPASEVGSNRFVVLIGARCRVDGRTRLREHCFHPTLTLLAGPGTHRPLGGLVVPELVVSA